jgi:hypothetical protein
LLGEKDALHLPQMKIQRLRDFLASAGLKNLTPSDRETICDQAALMIEQFYAHLPFKRARYAIDPVQRIRLLRARLGQISSDLAFHSELLQAFAELRDVHTSYRLPPPYSKTIAFLPFFLQIYFDRKHHRRFLVTNVLPGFTHPSFQAGVEVTQWNGMPVRRAVDLLAEHIPGGNPAAKFLRGMMRMTVRSLASTLPPDEEVVFIRYLAREGSAEEHIIQLPWFAGSGMGTDLRESISNSVCEPLKDFAIVRKVLWCPDEWKQEQTLYAQRTRSAQRTPYAQQSPYAQQTPSKQVAPLTSALPDVFQFQHSGGAPDQLHGAIEPSLLARADKRFGYVKIKTFEGDADSIFDEFKRILQLMQSAAPDGLILDVRSNAGGDINAAERLLQLLTPAAITPAQFHFANTPAMQDVIARLQELDSDRLGHLKLLEQINEVAPYFREWFSDTLEAVASGSLTTSGRPLTDPETANDTGQVYYGPVALVIDAASYSATDTFAAGFQDHRIGEIIGVDDNTGGGGASRWSHTQELVERLKGVVNVQPPLQPLPAGVSMAFALQRSARVGPNAGDPVEDIGVKCSIPYRITKADLLDFGWDLIPFACRVLAKKPTYRLEVIQHTRKGRAIQVSMKSSHIDCLVCFIDGHPELTARARGRQSLRIPLPESGRSAARELRINGYALHAPRGSRRKELTLVASAKLKVPRR